MSSSESIELKFKNIHVFDWYDGMARSIGFKEDCAYLIMLAAWDKKDETRIYILAHLGQATAKRMLELSNLPLHDLSNQQSLWNELVDCCEKHLKNYQGKIYLTTQEPIRQETILVEVVETTHLSKLLGYDLQRVVEEDSVRYWKNVIGSNAA